MFSKWFGIIFIFAGTGLYRTFFDPHLGVIGSIVAGALFGGLGGLIGSLIDHFLEKKKLKDSSNDTHINDEVNKIADVEKMPLQLHSTNIIAKGRRMSKLIYLLSALLIGLIAVFIYPTLYYYDKLDQKYPVKINRITGYTEMLTMNGWQVIDGSINNFTIGSTKNDVKKVMGPPWYMYNFPNSEMWYYKVSGKTSSIEFKDGKVIGWKDDDKILKIK